MSWESVGGSAPARTFEEVLSAARRAKRGESVSVEVAGLLLEGTMIDFSDRSEVPRGRLPPKSTVSLHEIETRLTQINSHSLSKIMRTALHHLLVAALAQDAMDHRD